MAEEILSVGVVSPLTDNSVIADDIDHSVEDLLNDINVTSGGMGVKKTYSKNRPV